MRIILSLSFALMTTISVFSEEVVVYTALDEIFSEPILDAFEAETGITVRAAYDTEASKTTGLVNRLIAEAEHPRADVFWNNEIAQSIILQNKGILTPYHSPSAVDLSPKFNDPEGYWTGFAARARVIIYNTDLVKTPPTSLFDLTKPEWKDKVGIALPLFGTTATHAAALFTQLGDEEAQSWFQGLKDNGAQILNGNATVRNRVARGEIPVGLTDTDDANGAVVDGYPAKWLFPDQGEGQIGTLLIPNTVCLIKNGPNPEGGKRLIDYLLSPEVETTLAQGRSLQIPLRTNVDAPDSVPKISSIRTMDVDFKEVADQMKPTARYIQETFAR